MVEAKRQEGPAASTTDAQGILDQILEATRRSTSDPSSDGWRYGLEPANNRELEQFAKWVVESGFRKDLKAPGAAAILIAAGRTHGLGVFAALECFDVVYGRPFLRGKAARAFLLRSSLVEHFEILEDPDDQEKPERAVLLVKRKNWAEPKRVTFTLDEAKRLGLLDRKKDDGSTAQTGWHTQPGVMLIERATTKCIRRHFPDILLGLGLEDELDEPKETPPAAPEPPKGATLKEVVTAAAPKARTKAPAPASTAKAPGQPQAAPEKPAEAPPAENRFEPLQVRLQSAWDVVKSQLGEEKGKEVWIAGLPEEQRAVVTKKGVTLEEYSGLVELAELLSRRVALAVEVNAARAALQAEGGPQTVPVSVPGAWSVEDLERMLSGDQKQLEALRANKG